MHEQDCAHHAVVGGLTLQCREMRFGSSLVEVPVSGGIGIVINARHSGEVVASYTSSLRHELPRPAVRDGANRCKVAPYPHGTSEDDPIILAALHHLQVRAR